MLLRVKTSVEYPDRLAKTRIYIGKLIFYRNKKYGIKAVLGIRKYSYDLYGDDVIKGPGHKVVWQFMFIKIGRVYKGWSK